MTENSYLFEKMKFNQLIETIGSEFENSELVEMRVREEIELRMHGHYHGKYTFVISDESGENSCCIVAHDFEIMVNPPFPEGSLLNLEVLIDSRKRLFINTNMS